MIPLIIYDLAHFDSANIKVFRVNFFLSKNAYHDGYNLGKNNIINWSSLAYHDPITQLNLTKKLWHTGQIEVDKDCGRVLRLSPKEYMKKMEDIYVFNSVPE